MTPNDSKILTQVKALPVRARAAFALTVAQMVVKELAEDPEGLRVAQEALRLSWRWVCGEPVKGEEIDQYVSSHTDKHLTRYELRYKKEAMRAAIGATSSAAAFAGRQAYAAEGATDDVMSQYMGEVDDEILDDLMNFATKTSYYNEEAVKRVCRFLIERSAGQGPEQVGGPITSDEVLSLISAVPDPR